LRSLLRSLFNGRHNRVLYRRGHLNHRLSFGYRLGLNFSLGLGHRDHFNLLLLLINKIRLVHRRGFCGLLLDRLICQLHNRLSSRFRQWHDVDFNWHGLDYRLNINCLRRCMLLNFGHRHCVSDDRAFRLDRIRKFSNGNNFSFKRDLLYFDNRFSNHCDLWLGLCHRLGFSGCGNGAKFER